MFDSQIVWAAPCLVLPNSHWAFRVVNVTMGSTSSNIFTVALVFSEAIWSGGACELYNLNGCIIRSTVHTKEFLTLPRNKMMLVKGVPLRMWYFSFWVMIIR